MWSEGQSLDAALGEELIASGARICTLDADPRQQPPAGHALMQVVSLDSTIGDKALRKLSKLLGESTALHQLDAPLGGAPAVLATAAVPAHTFDMLFANIRLRFPKLIYRGDVA